MQLVLISDTHANETAPNIIVKDIGRLGADPIMYLGDTATIDSSSLRYANVILS